MLSSVPSCRAATLLIALLASCDGLTPGPPLSRTSGVLARGQWVPRVSERDAIGRVSGVVARRSRSFSGLVESPSNDIVFKDEEATGADRMMTPRLARGLERLEHAVRSEWPGVHLRVTEAWDENAEHGPLSAHYEGRAADITTSDLDSTKLGRLAYLAVRAGLDWVYYEDASHVHVSVRK